MANKAYLIGCNIGKCHINCLVSLTQKLSLALLILHLLRFKHWHRLTTFIKILTTKGANIGTTVQIPQ